MFLSLFLLQLFFSDYPQNGGKLSENQAAIDSKSLRLVLTVDPEQKTISGFAEAEYQILRPNQMALELNLVDQLTVTEVLIDGKPRPFKRGDHKLIAALPKERGARIIARISYHGQPWESKRPPWQGGFNWSKTDSGQPWIGVSCQGEGGQLWYPCKAHQVDKIEGVKLEITVPEPLYCAANGLLQKIEPAKPGWRTFHWYTKYPIASYNISINIADYQVIEHTYKGSKEMPVVLYFLKEYQRADQYDQSLNYEEKLARLGKQTVDYLTFFSEAYGEYAFIDEKFGLAHTHYKGMEHQTINSYGGQFRNQFGVDSLMIHEMGHEWWGNKLTAGDLADMWLQEGICTYATGAYLEHAFGLDVALDYYRTKWFGISNQKALVQGKDLLEKDAYFGDLYSKGSLVVHALRFLLGKDLHGRILKTYINDPSHTMNNPTRTEDLIAVAENLSKRQLDWFFDIYVFRAEPPELTWRESEGTLQLSWDDSRFNMPIEVAYTGDGETVYKRLEFTDGKASWKIPDDVEYSIDPRYWVYKKLTKAN